MLIGVFVSISFIAAMCEPNTFPDNTPQCNFTSTGKISFYNVNLSYTDDPNSTPIEFSQTDYPRLKNDFTQFAQLGGTIVATNTGVDCKGTLTNSITNTLPSSILTVPQPANPNWGTTIRIVLTSKEYTNRWGERGRYKWDIGIYWNGAFTTLQGGDRVGSWAPLALSAPANASLSYVMGGYRIYENGTYTTESYVYHE
jgi:hypothetical protein